MNNMFDPELQPFYDKVRDKISKEQIEYFESHPEIRHLLGDFVFQILDERPQNVTEFAQHYFENANKNSQKPKPIVITAPSGCGKGTLIRKLVQDYPHIFQLSVSYTTRNPRSEDKEGVTYHFISKEQFEEDIQNGDFIEYAQYNGNYYGTSRKQVEKIQKDKKICILEIEVQGAQKVFASGLDCNFFFMLPPSIEELRNRLKGRGTETEEAVEKRLDIAKGELKTLENLHFFKKKLVNDNFDELFEKFVDWLQQIYPTIKF